MYSVILNNCRNKDKCVFCQTSKPPNATDCYLIDSFACSIMSMSITKFFGFIYMCVTGSLLKDNFFVFIECQLQIWSAMPSSPMKFKAFDSLGGTAQTFNQAFVSNKRKPTEDLDEDLGLKSFFEEHGHVSLCKPPYIWFMYNLKTRY